MQEITLKIPDKNFAFFKELIKALDFVKEVPAKAEKAIRKKARNGEEDFRPRTQEEIKADLIEAFKEAEEIIAGRKKGKTLQEFLNELQD